LAGNSNLTKTLKCGPGVNASDKSGLYRLKYKELWFKLGRGWIQNDYLCILRGSHVYCRTSTGTARHPLRRSCACWQMVSHQTHVRICTALWGLEDSRGNKSRSSGLTANIKNSGTNTDGPDIDRNYCHDHEKNKLEVSRIIYLVTSLPD